ncbi:Protein transport protein Sec24A [Operophtera brumata]|uniref:Protein transport protein Sec24A n=1 Tax=Operophtera brumata TaxID=104452 RepID=A0A0L7LH81_OPEBR|nr:Protein transport protein Sec24A [Operophtera brumata]
MQLSIEESLHDLQHVCFQAALLYTSSKGTECDRDSAVTSHAGMQLSIEESLHDLQHVCFQAALLYTSSKGTECDRDSAVTSHAGMQLSIEESLHDLQHVCFQAALLYTSSRGERRIRVHTMSLPIATTLPDVLHSADQQCIIGLLSKMGNAHRLAQNLPAGASTSALHAPESLRLLPLYLLALLKRSLHAGACTSALLAPESLRLLPLYLLALLMRKAFRTGTSTRLDDRVADMCALKSQPLSQLLRGVYPALYALHTIQEHLVKGEENELVPDPPRLQLTAERVNSNGAYLLDDGDSMIIYVGRNVSPAFLSETFGVTAFSQIPDEARSLPRVDSDTCQLLHAFIDRLNEDRPYASDILVLRDNSPSRLAFTERLVDDRVESAFSYYEFLQHVKNQVK